MERTVIDETLFSAYLKCETKFYLKFAGETGSDIEFANCKQRLVRRYKEEGQEQLRHSFRPDELFVGTPSVSAFRKKEYRLIIDCVLQVDGIKSHIHALEKMNTRGSRRSTPYAPVRFIPTGKITKQDKLLLAFDALATSRYLDKEPSLGKIIHGNEHSIKKVRLTELMKLAIAVVDEILRKQPELNPTAVILNKHCAECEFRSQCYERAVEKDDLSLLSGLSEKERAKLHKKGIFTVTQLSYTFRPRRRPKRDVSKPPRYYHSLRALAIREHKTFIAGRPQLDIAGTPVYLDVEGIPDEDFYYLIGFRFMKNGDFKQKSLWANDFADEKIIWYDFLESLSHIDNSKLIHYGSYETRFLKRMKERYGEGTVDPGFLDNLIIDSLNLLSIIYAQIYFPTYSNGLKDVARHLEFNWSTKKASGINVLFWRKQWELARSTSLKERITTYNAEDCQALQKVTEEVIQLCRMYSESAEITEKNVVYADSIKWQSPYRLQRNDFAIPEFQYINRCAYWDYQRDKIYVRSSKYLKRISRKKKLKSFPANKIIELSAPTECSLCNSNVFYVHAKLSKIIYDLKFCQSGIKRWTTMYKFNRYVCKDCHKTFYSLKKNWTRSNYGRNVIIYSIYQNIELRLSQEKVVNHINQLFGLNIPIGTFQHFKSNMSSYYSKTYQHLMDKLIRGNLIHTDETKINIRGSTDYVWALTNLEAVVYIYTKTREADMIQTLLTNFTGVLVSDFYSAYDSINCPQQKCLIHLIRDLNDDLFKEPFNEEYKELVWQFGFMLKPMMETIDRYGLKKHYLRKHNKDVGRFYKILAKANYESEVARKYKKRFHKYRHKLFTFLEHDDVPWNNNNAEHAIKAFATLRKVIGATSSEKGIQEYLILLSICETCKYKGISFLQFLRSGQADIDEFLRARHSRK